MAVLAIGLTPILPTIAVLPVVEIPAFERIAKLAADPRGTVARGIWSGRADVRNATEVAKGSMISADARGINPKVEAQSASAHEACQGSRIVISDSSECGF